MTEQIQLKRAEPAVPQEIAELFGQRHLVLGEKTELYDALSARIVSAVHPEDIVEWFWVKDITDLLWEIQRLRRFKAATINNGRKAALRALFRIVIEDGQLSVPELYKKGQGLAHEFTSGEGKAKKDLQSLLEKNGFDEHSVAAKAFSLGIEVLETVDRLLAAAELRRDRILREIDFHRETLGRRMREAVDVEDKKPALLASAEKEAGSVHN
jgi:hypothetical protein